MISAFRSVVAGLAALAVCAPAIAQVNSKNQGYLIWGANSDVVTTPSGLCVRTSDWTPARAAAAEACKLCTPELCPAPPAAAKPEAKPEAKPAAKPQMMNVELKIELQGIAFMVKKIDAALADLR